jgi:hypothetical protein
MSHVLAAILAALLVTVGGHLIAVGLLDDVKALIKEKQAAEQKVASLVQQESQARIALQNAMRGQAAASQSNNPEGAAIFGQAVAVNNRTIEQSRAGQASGRTQLESLSVRGRELCSQVDRQAKSDRDAIERQMETNHTSQEELERWTAANADAQREALFASVKFMAGTYAADAERLGQSVSKLQRRVELLAQQGRNTVVVGRRTRYLKEMDAAIAQLMIDAKQFAAKTVVGDAEKLYKGWEIARDSMRNELRVAQKSNETLKALVTDSPFKEAVLGDDLDKPGIDALSNLIEEVGTNQAKLTVGLKRFEKMAGPTIRAATFVRDAWYSALLSYESTARVLQQNDVAGMAAVAAGALQQQYENTIDAVVLCREAGFLDPLVAGR